MIGRPVHFVDDDPKRDQRAEDSLRQAARGAGFREVGFQLEPIAAAFDYEQRVTRESLILIADIGGGTSDFTVVRVGPERIGRADRAGDVLATAGVHIGGTDFDQRLNLERVMPRTRISPPRPAGARGAERRVLRAVDLAPDPLAADTQGDRTGADAAQQLPRHAAARSPHARAATGRRAPHRERGGAGQDRGLGARGRDALGLDHAEPGLSTTLTPLDLQQQLAALLERVVAGAHACVQRAGLRSGNLDAIYLTGGSSALRPFQQALRRSFAGVSLVEGDLFGGVAAGLAYAACEAAS